MLHVFRLGDGGKPKRNMFGDGDVMLVRIWWVIKSVISFLHALCSERLLRMHIVYAHCIHVRNCLGPFFGLRRKPKACGDFRLYFKCYDSRCGVSLLWGPTYRFYNRCIIKDHCSVVLALSYSTCSCPNRFTGCAQIILVAHFCEQNVMGRNKNQQYKSFL